MRKSRTLCSLSIFKVLSIINISSIDGNFVISIKEIPPLCFSEEHKIFPLDYVYSIFMGNLVEDYYLKISAGTHDRLQLPCDYIMKNKTLKRIDPNWNTVLKHCNIIIRSEWTEVCGLLCCEPTTSWIVLHLNEDLAMQISPTCRGMPSGLQCHWTCFSKAHFQP